MKKIGISILGLIFLFLSLVNAESFGAPAEGNPQKDAGPSGGGQSVEVLMNTLNETLEENRQIRAQMQALQEALEKIAIENNVLNSRVRQLQSLSTEAGTKEKEKIDVLAKGLEKMADEAKKLKGESEGFRSDRLEAERKLAEVEEENEKLRKILGDSVLASEKEEYLAMIGQAEKAATQSIQQLSELISENQKLKEELTSAHYHLGNVFFEAKDYKSAIAQYQAALQQDPTHPWIHYNLAVIHDYYLNDRASALFHYREYLALKPAEEKAREIRRRVLDLQMLKNVTPTAPLRADFDRLHRSSET